MTDFDKLPKYWQDAINENIFGIKTTEKKLKQEVWELIEKEIPNASDSIGWGSMDSLCDDLINLIKENVNA